LPNSHGAGTDPTEVEVGSGTTGHRNLQGKNSGLVEGCVILELKSVTELLPLHKAQLLTYLRWTQRSLGLLINFNVPVLPKGL
jgi:hypothetical protein